MKNILYKIKSLMPSKKIWRGLRNASYLTIGHFLSMFINFFGFILIARILGPSEYGIYTTVGAFVGLFVILTFNGLQRVVLREGAKDLNQMSDYLEKTVGLKFFITFIAINISIICSVFTPYTFHEKVYIIVFSFTLIYSSFSGFFGIVYQAAEKMQYNAFIEVFNRILFVPISIVLLYMGFGLPGLFSIALFSQFLTLFVSYRLTKRFLIFEFFSKIRWDRYILKSAIIFSILSFTVLLTTRIDVVMISWLGTSEDVGIYGVAFQITNMVLIVRNLLAVAFFPMFVKMFHKKMVRWRNLLRYAFLMGFGMFLIAIVGSYLSEPAVVLLFGATYSESGAILSVLIFYLAVTFFSIPFTNAFQATHNEGVYLSICWIQPSLNIGLNYLFFNMFGLIGIAYSTLVVTFCSTPILVFVIWRTLKKQNKII